MENQPTIVDCLIMLQAAYPRLDLGAQTLKTYQLSLADMDPSLLYTAVLRLISTSKWLPTVSELRGTVLDLQLEAQGHLSAPEAWGLISREISRVGHWGEPKVPPAVRQAMDATGGWRHLCVSENIISNRARFIEAYNELCKREIEKLQQMPAVTEAQEKLAEERKKVDTAVSGLLSSMNGNGNSQQKTENGKQKTDGRGFG